MKMYYKVIILDIPEWSVPEDGDGSGNGDGGVIITDTECCG
jgi:hypothetical protein